MMMLLLEKLSTLKMKMKVEGLTRKLVVLMMMKVLD